MVVLVWMHTRTILCRGILLRTIMHIVRGHDRQIHASRQWNEFFIDLYLLLESMILDLDEESIPAKNLGE